MARKSRLAEPAEAAVPPLIAEAAERPRVLVVDDDERNLLAITNVLEDIAEVVVADSGEAALRQLLRHEFAVILLDVYMPGIDGYETAGLIRAREQTKRVPIVFLSAVNKEIEHLLRGYAMGAVDYVFKPVEPSVLRSKVSVFVDLFEMTKEVERKARHEQQLLDANLRANAELLEVEKRLRLAEQRQAAIIQSLPIILYLEEIDAQPRLPKFVSGNFAAVTGFEFDEIRKRPETWVERLHPDDRERVVATLAERPLGRGLSIEYRWQCRDGGYRHFLDQAVLLRDPAGDPLEFAGTLLDVTDRHELELQLNQARKMDAIGQLTGGIAHDFNNLLAAVLGGIGMIERRVPLDEAQQKVVGMTRHAAEQGAELIKHLLAFSRRQKLEPAAVDVNSLAGNLNELMTHTLGGITELKWQFEDALHPVFADAAQLELALMNLIINARDAMPEGGTISVQAANREIDEASASPDLGAGSYVVIAITDTGCGIEPALLDQVLEPFFTTKAVGKGTGLGLSMVYGFAKQSGGAIRIESEVGAGTRVEIWLPAAEGASAPRKRVAAAAPAPCERQLRILLVDDHDGVRATTAALLQDLGHGVVDVSDGQSAIELLTAAPDAFDLVLTDYAMPKLSGTELVRRLRKLRHGLPAAIITGNANPGSAIAPSADTPVLTKPFSDVELRSCLNSALGGTA
jgi:PAS domain S-box-containing protein